MIFLRPWAFILLIVPLLIKGLKHFRHTQTPWAKFIDKNLLPALLIKSKGGKLKSWWTAQTLLLWIIWVVALAGPAFYKLPTPAVESAPNTVIVFDLSMQPKELLQGQTKLYDLLSDLKGDRVGLVVFGQNQGYTAIPLTPDVGLVKEIVPNLTAGVLPEPAQNPEVGFQYAAELLDNAGGKGRILYVTDTPKSWKGHYPFGVLDLTKRTADDEDIKYLLNQTKKGDSVANDTTFSTTADTWADLGAWLVLISLPFFCLMFRKGVLFLMLLFWGIQTEAGFFWRPDQETYQRDKKATNAYLAKEYQRAANLFQQSENFYNLGNALAYSGDIQGAIEAYKKELAKNPDNKDAEFNKEYLEKQLSSSEQQQQKEGAETKDQKNDSDENSEQNQNNNQNEQNRSENAQQNQGQSDKEEKGNQPNNEQPTQDETQEELEQALADYENENPYNQEEQQIINRLNHDPARVLRYRLYLQHQKGQMK